jgi:anti-sigma factor RsiW
MHEPAPLREQLKQMLQAERLDDAQFDRLQALSQPKWDHGRRRWWAVAAAALIAVALGAVLLRPSPQAWQLDQIARHVSHYHLETPPLEVQSESLSVVQAALGRLDFQPQLPAVAGDWRLQGGRHCTLLGGIASQLLFRAGDGQRITLYEAAFDPERFTGLPEAAQGEPPLEIVYRGLRIRVWVESGLVMAEVRDTAPNPRPLRRT